ncbi:MAG: type I-B CRISPR-associated protein Cas5b [Candidatus Methanoperedens sp.]|nr:type I-B CRISPR-associated protein Cas5b [Candidatus Methanoperedens sp.]
MSEKIVLIEIFQPFAQYRNPFTFYYAQTYPLPPKSTVIVMLQNAVGDWYGNELGIENWWNLKVSVHGGFENAFWNYQSLIKGEIRLDKNMKLINYNNKHYLPLYGEGQTSQRTPVHQQELFNGHLYIFIKGEGNLIEKIKEALKKPAKVLYLGRSEDVVFIRNVNETVAKKINVEGDIKLKYPTYLLQKNFSIKNQKYPVYSIPLKVIFENNRQNVKHKSEITKSTERKPEFEPIIYTGYDYSIILNENSHIDVEFYTVKDDEKIRIIDPFGWL